jgi:NAD(P)-dependent dehydrogenase (short-subunit alcohol dehydrogenase family)
MKTIIICGGSGFLGIEVCKSLSKKYKILLLDLKKPAINLSEFKNIKFINFNLSNSYKFEKLLINIKEKYKEIYGLINLIYPEKFKTEKNLLSIKETSFTKSLNKHIATYFIICQKFIKVFSKTKKPIRIINFSSIYGEILPKFEIYKNTKMYVPLDYCISKNAIIVMTKYLAKYFKKKNIIINSISPGGVFDNQDKKFIKKYTDNCINKGMLDSKDIICGVNFLLDENNIYYNGQNLIIDDGFTL